MKNPDAILTADFHIRSSVPVCRTDDFRKAQLNKLVFIRDLATTHKCPILIAGDIFQRAKSDPFLEQSFLNIFFGCKIYFVAGNHDLPNHNLSLFEKASVAVLQATVNVSLLKPDKPVSSLMSGISMQGASWGEEPKQIRRRKDSAPSVLVYHKYVHGPNKNPNIEGISVGPLLKKYSGYDLILTGDNHQSFSDEHEKTLLVNPGSITRQTADQDEHVPRVALWYAEENEIEWVDLPAEENVISREHLDVEEERNERLDAFVTKLDESYEVGLSFEKNLEEYLKTNGTGTKVTDMIWEAVKSETN